MPDVNVGVAWVSQETLYYCGPATLEMLLVTLGVARPASPPSWQDRIWADVQANTGATRPSAAPSTPTAPAFPTQKCERCDKEWKCWATTPEVLRLLINQYQATATFAIATHATERSATGVLLDALDVDLPAVALVRGWQHWLVVEGYRHGEAGSTVVAGRNLNGVFIRDPRENETVHYVTWSTWKTSYLSFVPCGDYYGTYVVMGGTRRALPAPPPPPANVRIVTSAESEPLPITIRLLQTLITAEDAVKAAGAAAAELRRSPRLNPGLGEADARWALLVQRLDRFDSYYYIVTFTSAGRETARVIVDAHDGNYTEVSAVPQKDQTLPPYIPAPEMRQRIASLGERVTSELPFQLRAEAMGDHPVAVWKPCAQSSSPFLPFYQYTIGDAFVYYRLDGARFDELTEGPA